MKQIRIIFLLVAALNIFYSCYKDEPDTSKSIFDDENAPARTEFDNWLYTNYTIPYNIEFNYLYNDKLTDNYYNVVPASIDKSKSLAILIKHVWLKPYTTVAGEEFVKENAFRVFQLIGSGEYTSQGSIVLGTAEGGIKVTLYRVNEIDIENIFVNQDNPYRPHEMLPLDLNYWYFHTMHHEFCHILTQKKNYPTDFQEISAGKYHSSDWINVDDEEAPLEGFVTGYASGEYNEDFAEIFSVYVTSSDEAWAAILEKGVTEDGDTYGKDVILAKLDIVKTYLEDSWGLDMDALRAEVLKCSSEAADLDLVNLN